MSRTGKAAGGHARAEALTPERRREIASAAARARWRGKAAGGPVGRRDAATTASPSSPRSRALGPPVASARQRDALADTRRAVADVLDTGVALFYAAAFECQQTAVLLEGLARRLRRALKGRRS